MSMEDEFAKTVTIPVRIKDGTVKYFYDNESGLPKISDVEYAELIIPRNSLLDNELINKLTEEKTVDFIEKGTELYAQISINDMHKLDEVSQSNIQTLKTREGREPFIEIKLYEDLELTLRGSKKARLKNCRCEIPALDDKEAMSLNQAYTLISEKFEPGRRSHSGNVFDKIYFLQDDVCYKIEKIRNRLQSRYEEECLWVKEEKK